MSKVINYIKETKAELKHVSWPTQRQSIILTSVVIVISLIVAAYLGAFDFIFVEILQFTL